MNAKQRLVGDRWFPITIAVVSVLTHCSISAEVRLDDVLYGNYLGSDSKEVSKSFAPDSVSINQDGWQTVSSVAFEGESFDVSIEMHLDKCVSLSITKGQLPVSPNSRELFERLAGELRDRFGDAPVVDMNKFVKQEDATEAPGYTWVNDTQSLGIQYSISPYGASILVGLNDKQHKLNEAGSIPREMGNLETVFNKYSGRLPDDWGAARESWETRVDSITPESKTGNSEETVSRIANADTPSKMVPLVDNDWSVFRLKTFMAIGILGLLIGVVVLIIRFLRRKQ